MEAPKDIKEIKRWRRKKKRKKKKEKSEDKRTIALAKEERLKKTERD